MNRELFYRQLRQKRTKSLGESIESFFKDKKLEDKYMESFLQSEWKNIVGETIAKHTSTVMLKGNKVVIKIESAPLRNELLMSKKLLLKNICNHLHTEKIHDIIFL